MKKLAQQGMDALSSEDPAYNHMQQMADWADLLIDLYQKALNEWRERQQEQPSAN